MDNQNKVEFREEKNIKHTYLYVNGININNESYETKILLEENINKTIKFGIVYDEDKEVLRYDVSNTVSFEEYLKNHKLSKSDICDIIDAVDQVLSNIENFLVAESSVSLNLRAIRLVRTTSGHIAYKFILIPNNKVDFSYELSKFLMKILKYVDIEDKTALSLAYALFVKGSKDNYTINDLLELVDAARDKKKRYDDVDTEALSEYDEEMASEFVDSEYVDNNMFILQDYINIGGSENCSEKKGVKNNISINDYNFRRNERNDRLQNRKNVEKKQEIEKFDDYRDTNGYQNDFDDTNDADYENDFGDNDSNNFRSKNVFSTKNSLASRNATIGKNDFDLDDIDEINDDNDDNGNLEIKMDSKTRENLQDSFFDDFDTPKKDKDIVGKVKKGIFGIRPKKQLSGHISILSIQSIITPIIAIFIPIFHMLYYGYDKFIKFLPGIILCEVVLLTIMIVENIRNT